MTDSTGSHGVNGKVSFTLSDGLPSSLKRKIEACPCAGGGLHVGLKKIFNELRHYMDAEEGGTLLYDLAISRGRSPKIAKAEIREFQKKWYTDTTYNSRDAYTTENIKPSIERIRSIVNSSTATLDELQRISPVKVDISDENAADDIVDLLFPNGEIICVTDRKEYSAAYPHKLFTDNGYSMGTMQFIVPNPVRECGSYEPDVFSPRTLDKILYRRWLVIEFDIAKYGRDGITPTFWKPLIEEWEAQRITTKDAQCALIDHLSEFNIKLGMVVSSGGKSLHSWFAVSKLNEDQVVEFMRYAESLGADHAGRQLNQWMRMPHGIRNDEKYTNVRQPVVYLNLRVLQDNEN